jgi:hypothetical protein
MDNWVRDEDVSSAATRLALANPMQARADMFLASRVTLLTIMPCPLFQDPVSVCLG